MNSSVPLFGSRSNLLASVSICEQPCSHCMALSMYSFKTERLYLAVNDGSIGSFLENKDPQQKCGWSMKFSSNESSLRVREKKQREAFHIAHPNGIRFMKSKSYPSSKPLSARHLRHCVRTKGVNQIAAGAFCTIALRSTLHATRTASSPSLP